VAIGGEVRSSIGPGLLILLGVGHDDCVEDVDYLVNKTVALRIFDDGEGVMNLSVRDSGGDAIVVSQFTLMAATRKGNRPSYINAAGMGRRSRCTGCSVTNFQRLWANRSGQANSGLT
jgi:D-tyrosyl-tRNA(Tyr) deacylase